MHAFCKRRSVGAFSVIRRLVVIKLLLCAQKYDFTVLFLVELGECGDCSSYTAHFQTHIHWKFGIGLKFLFYFRNGNLGANLVHMNLPQDPILSQMNPVHIFT
jgi:hypothetical protein